MLGVLLEWIHAQSRNKNTQKYEEDSIFALTKLQSKIQKKKFFCIIQVDFNVVCVLDTAYTYSGFMGGLLLLAMIFISSKRLLYNWICVALSSCV